MDDGWMDGRTELLKSFDRRIEANTTATKQNKDDNAVLQKKLCDIQKEKISLKNNFLEG